MSTEDQRRRLYGRESKEEKKEIRTIEELGEAVLLLERDNIKLSRKLEKSRRPVLGLAVVINNNLYIMPDIALTISGPNLPGIFVLTDNKTSAVIANPVFSAQAVGANSNPAAATFALDLDNKVVPTAIAVGSGTVVFSTHATYTDPGDNSPEEGDFNVTKVFTVKASPDGASLDVVFS